MFYVIGQICDFHLSQSAVLQLALGSSRILFVACSKVISKLNRGYLLIIYQNFSLLTLVDYNRHFYWIFEFIVLFLSVCSQCMFLILTLVYCSICVYFCSVHAHIPSTCIEFCHLQLLVASKIMTTKDCNIIPRYYMGAVEEKQRKRKEEEKRRRKRKEEEDEAVEEEEKVEEEEEAIYEEEEEG